jgi:hypothetical protein
MTSPFPGMDPYLERHWLDVQPRLIVGACNHLQTQLADDLVARIEERLLVESPTDDDRQIGPDVRIVETAFSPIASRAGGIAVAAEPTEPVVYRAESEPISQRFIEIVDTATGGRVLTVIEFVSPTNKLAGDGREMYQRKQQECRGAGVNLVEIDLTRAGKRQLIAHRFGILPEHRTAYQVSIWRVANPQQCELYPIRLEARLPVIRIPLRPADTVATLDIQALVDGTYALARYGRTIDYSRACTPPLAAGEGEWAEELLRRAGKR